MNINEDVLIETEMNKRIAKCTKYLNMLYPLRRDPNVPKKVKERLCERLLKPEFWPQI